MQCLRLPDAVDERLWRREDRSLSLALGLLVVGEAVAASVLMAEISSTSTSTNMQTGYKDPQSLTRGRTPSGLMCSGIGWSLACSGGGGVVEEDRKVYRKDVKLCSKGAGTSSKSLGVALPFNSLDSKPTTRTRTAL